MSAPQTLGEAFEQYLNRVSLKSAHTQAAYSRAVDLFWQFLQDKRGKNALPIQKPTTVLAQEIPLKRLSKNDTEIFKRFAQWLMETPKVKAHKLDKRPYALATVKLRIAGIQHWFQFMRDSDWLPKGFLLDEAIYQGQIFLRDKEDTTVIAGPSSFNEDMHRVVTYYDTQEPPASFKNADPESERYFRWELTRLRNRALLHCLADTGGRISEILNLNTNAFFGTSLTEQKQLPISVLGKGGHPYTIYLSESLAVIQEYLRKRGILATDKDQALFVSHDARYENSRMSRIVAWRVVRRAAKACGMGDLSPQEFRHWRALQLIKQGHRLEEIRDLLGHRSIETIKQFYGAALDR